MTVAVLAAIMLPAKADEIGVSEDAILFGQAAALEGPSSTLGQRMRQGIVAAFTEINAKGGVHGRKLQLISRDDGYDPDRSLAQTLRLIEDEKVFALIGAVGTPTAVATIPITSARNVPFIGPFSGAEFLRDFELANVVNIRASYGAEAEAWVKHLTEDRHFTRIAIFYQDDSFGRDGLSGVKRALARRGLELAAEGTFERNTRAVASAWRTIKRVEPEAIVMVGTYGPCAEFIKLAHRSGANPTFVNISFVGAVALAKELGPEGEGVVVTQVVPFPWDRSLKLVADYQAAQTAFDPALTPSGARRLYRRPSRGRGAGTSRTATDAREPAAHHQRCRPLRHQRQHHHRRHAHARRAAEGVFDGDPEGRDVQSCGPAIEQITAAASSGRR